jgi:plasmid stabilization system protein ParE
VTRVIFREEALTDVLDAFAFYEERQPGLGERFRDHLDIAVAAIQSSPELYPVVYRDVRRRLVERFPYIVLYRLYPGIVVVVAVMHAKQNPARWKRRASSNDPG